MKKLEQVSLADMAKSESRILNRGDSAHMSAGAPPTLDDLAQSLQFSPGDGRIWLNGQRMQLMHTSSLGDLRRGEALAEQLQHLPLALGQQGRVATVGARANLARESCGELGSELRVPLRDGVDGARDLVLGGVLREVSAGTGP